MRNQGLRHSVPSTALGVSIPSLSVLPGGLAGQPSAPAPLEDALIHLMKGVSGLLPVDRLLVLGTISARNLEALMAERRAALAVVHPDRPYPCPEPVDVAWLLAIRHRDQAERRIAQACHCLVPGGRLLVQLQGSAAEEAPAIAARLRQMGLVRVAAMPIGAESVLISGQASLRHHRAA